MYESERESLGSALLAWAGAVLIVALAVAPSVLVYAAAPQLEVPVAILAVAAGAIAWLVLAIAAARDAGWLRHIVAAVLFFVSLDSLLTAAVLLLAHGSTQVAVAILFAAAALGGVAAKRIAQRAG